MYIRSSFTFFANNVRCISTTRNAFANHYDVLGLTQKATQAEIKTAYYKLSKVYHPDKNQGSADAAVKFRDITAAYEILGNVRSRRLYDKGVHVERTPYQHPGDEDDPKTRFYRSREHRQRPMGRTPIYDFDEWSRAHYGATFAKDMERKKREVRLREMRERSENEARVEKVVLTFLLFLGIVMYFTRDNYDNDRTCYDTLKTNKTKPP